MNPAQPSAATEPLVLGRDSHSEGELISGGPRSLRELIERVSGRGLGPPAVAEDAGLAEAPPFPFLALVGQTEMKLALVLGLINPAIGGVLLVGPRGVGKTTAVRALTDLLPAAPRSLCFYGCLPEDIESGGIDAVCPDCAQKYALGQPLAQPDHVRLVELPLSAQMEDVVGGLDERAALHDRTRLKRGLLAQADRNLLYIDEVNLLPDEIADAILDAAAQGRFTVRRGPVSAAYRARFSLIGSMNPEEGRLRPQIMDRFGLRVIVRGLTDPQERLEAYRRVQTYLVNPNLAAANFAEETAWLRAEIQAARDALPKVELPADVARAGLAMVQSLQIDSLRAEITMFEAGRAYAAADNRATVTLADLATVAPMALRSRRSPFMAEFFALQDGEDQEIKHIAQSFLQPNAEETHE